jgi:hypothetical protein
MNRLAQITALSASIDTTLNEFALAANPAGEYPWQQAQRERRNRRVAGAAVGTVAVGAGVYGAKKGMDALNKRYGTSGVDGVKTGAADLVNRADDAMKGGVAKVKAAAEPMIAKAKDMAAPVLNPLKRKVAAGKLSYARGKAQKQGMGKMIGRVARAVIHASRADQIIALEAKMDGVLAEFSLGTTGAVIGAVDAAIQKKDGETTPEYLQRTAKGAVKGALIGTGAKVASVLAGGALMAYAKRHPKMRNAMMRGERYRSKFGSMPRVAQPV